MRYWSTTDSLSPGFKFCIQLLNDVHAEVLDVRVCERQSGKYGPSSYLLSPEPQVQVLSHAPANPTIDVRQYAWIGEAYACREA